MTDCSAAAAPLPCCSSHCSSRRLAPLADLRYNPQEMLYTQCHSGQMSVRFPDVHKQKIARRDAMVPPGHNRHCLLCAECSAQQVGKVLLQGRSYVGNRFSSIWHLHSTHADLAFADKALQALVDCDATIDVSA